MAEAITERFASDTKHHKLIIVRDDGLYRHLSFRNASSSCYWFELITVPNALIFRGDGDSFVFSRTEDMFAFFRSSSWKGGINPQYWAEKVTSSRTELSEYSEDLFKQRTIEAFVECARGEGVPAGTGRALRWQVLDHPDIAFALPARRLLNTFEHEGFYFEDAWEWSFTEWTWWYLWACHAIVWGIAQYDAARAEAAPCTNSVVDPSRLEVVHA